jgi:hypothetical protein
LIGAGRLNLTDQPSGEAIEELRRYGGWNALDEEAPITYPNGKTISARLHRQWRREPRKFKLRQRSQTPMANIKIKQTTIAIAIPRYVSSR